MSERRSRYIASETGRRMPEHEEQTVLLEWCALNTGRFPELSWIYAVPNGARTSRSQARRLKEEGMKKGVPDLVLPVPRGRYHGLYMELKATDGKASPEQKEWLAFLKNQGYYAALVFGFDQAKDTIEYYFGLSEEGETEAFNAINDD